VARHKCKCTLFLLIQHSFVTFLHSIMKKIIALLSACLLTSCWGFSQDSTAFDCVPSVIKESFIKKYPAATDIKFSNCSCFFIYNEVLRWNDYCVGFKDGEIRKAVFDVSGKWILTVTEIKETDLPKAMLDSVAKRFSDIKITSVSKVNTPSDSLYYSILLTNDQKNYMVRVSHTGEIMVKRHKSMKIINPYK
jgi:hypothetical protein